MGREAFLEAWKKAISRFGNRGLFGDKTIDSMADIEEATDLDALAPRYDAIREGFGHLSSGERRFLVILLSFYDSQITKELMRKYDMPIAFLDQYNMLDPERVEDVHRLMRTYCGW